MSYQHLWHLHDTLTLTLTLTLSLPVTSTAINFAKLQSVAKFIEVKNRAIILAQLKRERDRQGERVKEKKRGRQRELQCRRHHDMHNKQHQLPFCGRVTGSLMPCNDKFNSTAYIRRLVLVPVLIFILIPTLIQQVTFQLIPLILGSFWFALTRLWCPCEPQSRHNHIMTDLSIYHT